MNVKELILALQKMPKHMRVAFQDHDQDEDEINDFIRLVRIGESNEEKIVILRG